jgi:DNA-binding CsgD family transcriptional regulator/tetratricopeptide (TPR) repeat protein
MSFVGREHELERLGSALERAARGELTRVVVAGPTGMGTSTILAELEGRVSREPGLLVAHGAAYEPLAGHPYAALSMALRGPLTGLSDAQLARVVGAGGQEVSLLVPELAERLGRIGAISETPLLSAPDQRGSRLVETVLGIIARLGEGGAVLLTLDDAHWADPGTRAFVDAVLRISLPLPLCLVVAYHADELHRHHPLLVLARQMADDPAVESLDLRPFRRDELLRLIESQTGERPSAGLVAAIAEGSGGVPLLAGQMLAARRSVPAVRLSDSFEEILQARLSVLSVAAVRAIRVLAAIRRPVDRERFLALEVTQGRVSEAGIRDAIDGGFVTDVGGNLAISQGSFAEAVDSLLDPGQRHVLHAALAEAIDGPPAERAWHAEQALQRRQARDWHLAAADVAEELDPGGTALEHLVRALELGDAAEPATVDRPILLARAAQAAFVLGSFRRAAGLASQAIEARAGTDALLGAPSRESESRRLRGQELATLYERLGRYRWAAGEPDAALAAFQTAVELAPAEPSVDRARVLAALAQALMLEGRYPDSARAAREAITVARAAGPESLAELGHATCTLGVDIAYEGDIEGGLRLLGEAAAVAREAGRLDDLMRVYANQTTLLDLDSRREDALAIVEKGIAEARRWGQEAVYGAFLRGNAADILFVLGRWRQAEEMCRRALEWNPSGIAWINPLAYLVQVRIESAADEEAGRLLGQLLLQLEIVPDAQWTATVQRASVSFALWREDLVDAQRAVTRGWTRILQMDDWTQVASAASTTVEVAAAVAEDARARRDASGVAGAAEFAAGVLEAAELRVAASGVPDSLGARREAELHVATARAHLDRLHGRPDPDAWGTIAEGWAAVPVPYLTARARWWEAEAALRARPDRPRARADRGRARRALLESWRLASELGAEPLRRELRRLAARARLALPDAGAAAPEEGTPDLERPAPGASGPMAFHAPSIDATGPGEWSPEAPGSLGPTGPEEAPARLGLAQRIAPQPAEPSGTPFNLSPRELEVLGVLAEGRTNREIARRLFISERTVAVHVGNILAKLGVSGRVEAATVALRLGLVPAGSALSGVAPESPRSASTSGRPPRR